MAGAAKRVLTLVACGALIAVFFVGILATVPLVTKGLWLREGEVVVPAPFVAGAQDYYGTADPDILQGANGSYQMWYTGYVGMEAGIVGQILLASSTDGFHWTKHGPVLGVNETPWKFIDIATPWVLQEGSSYHMWFNAYQNGTPWQVYSAHSGDGANWSVDGVALAPGGNEEARLLGSVVSMPDGGFRMYYGSVDGAGSTVAYTIGMAGSPDGLVFAPVGTGPVFVAEPGGGWDCQAVSEPRVFRGTPWTMYYTGWGPCAAKGFSTNGIGVATSADGVNWIRSPGNPLISPSDNKSAFDGDSLGSAFVLAGPTGPILYYTGSRPSPEPYQAWWGIGAALPGTTTVPLISLDPLITDASLVLPPLLALGGFLEGWRLRRRSKPLVGEDIIFPAEESGKGPRLPDP